MVSDKTSDQVADTLRGVGVVSIHHHVQVGLDLMERLPNGVSLAATVLPEYSGSVFGRNDSGPVVLGVVDNHNLGLRKRRAERIDDASDGHLLVQARHDDRHSDME